MWKKILLGVAALGLVGGIVAYVLTRPEPADTRFSGAYVLEDGTQVFVAPREGKVLRYRLMNGESGALWPTGEGEYEGGPGWGEREPVVNRVKFARDDGRSGFDWRRGDGDKVAHARWLDLPERISKFSSGDLSLRGKLVLPQGAGPFPAVVIVHGSEDSSAVDYYYEPYMYAANGFAALAFDKRGTGESGGKYLQNFHVLSDDVVAAVRWLRSQPGINGNRIHLAGFSQGGWIAPLAALKDGNIRSILVGYGVMVPVTGEDRWGYFYALQQKGFGADAVDAADRVNAVIGRHRRSSPESLERARQHAGCITLAALVRGRARQRLRSRPGHRLEDPPVGMARCSCGGASARRATRRSSTACTTRYRRCRSCRRRACGSWAAKIRAPRRRGRCASWRSCSQPASRCSTTSFPAPITAS